MSKKKIFSLIIVLFVIAAASISYFFLKGEDSSKIKEPAQYDNPFGDFFPTDNVSSRNSQEKNMGAANMQQIEKNKLKLISDVPVSGITVFERKLGTSTAQTVARFAERATGHILEHVSGEESSNRISNTTIPKIYQSIFPKNSNSVILRYLDSNESIDTFVAVIKNSSSATTTEGEGIIEGVFMKKNIIDIVVSPDGKNLFNLIKNTEEKSSIIALGSLSLLSNPNTEKLILNSYISEWNLDWISNDVISFNNNASYASGGYLYLFNIKTKAFDKILGPLNGLMSKVSPSASKVIYSLQNDGTIETRFYNIKKGDVYKIPESTIAEKCVWAQDDKTVYCAIPSNIIGAKFPDNWYTGESSFNDSLVKIDTELQKTKTVLDSSDSPAPFDMINLQISPKQDVLYFVNKKDLKLWSIEI